MKRSTVAIVGAGNLAWSLVPALQKGGLEVRQLFSRNAEKLLLFQQTFGIKAISTQLSYLRPDTDFIFITVSDSAISSIIPEIPYSTARIIHCSGSVSLLAPNPMRFTQTGVFYPMQSFTLGIQADFANIPIFLEASDGQPEDLSQIARHISQSVHWLDSQERRQIHMGAVWVNNFSNALYQIAEDLLPKKKGLDFSIYLPLIDGQIKKLQKLSPKEAQTGPAVRGDILTLNAHLQLLEKRPELQAIYNRLSQLINPAIVSE